jgi:NitT/TauT family transport system substrate-binding protein
MRRFWLIVAALITAIAPAFAADHVIVGTTRLIGYVSVPVGLAHGYFEAEGIDVEQVYFDSAQPIAVAAAAGDIDFGIAGPSAGFYNLAAQGHVKLIGASGGDGKGFHALEFLGSNKAWDAGLKTPHDLPGHSIAITQLGTALHNVIGILAERDGFPLSAIEVKPLQSNSVVTSALIGGTIDAAVMPNGPILNLVDKGQIRFLGWTSDYAPLKAGVMLLGSKHELDEHGRCGEALPRRLSQSVQRYPRRLRGCDGNPNRRADRARHHQDHQRVHRPAARTGQKQRPLRSARRTDRSRGICRPDRLAPLARAAQRRYQDRGFDR